MKNTICMCENCILAIRSRGERVIVIDCAPYSPKVSTCEWCREEVDDEYLYECRFE